MKPSGELFLEWKQSRRLGVDVMEASRWPLKEICPRGNNKVVIHISLYHDECLLFMLELY